MVEGLLHRRRLLDALSVAPQIRVVSAPSGFGKTTLVRTWVDEIHGVAGRPGAVTTRVIWVSLNADVTSGTEFWRLIGASAVRDGHLDSADLHRFGGRAVRLQSAVPVLTEALDGTGPILLVIDGYEHVRRITGEMDDDLLRIAAAAPNLGIVITTRATTRLASAALAVRGAVRVIDEQDLCFTGDEVEALLAMHAPASTDAAQRVADDTRGYPLAVRAAVYALAQRGTTPPFESDAWKRIVTEDLRSQLADPALFEFALDTCVPPYFDPELAATLTGAETERIDAALTELAWNGFGRWIPYARGCPVFQFIDSVRDALLAQLRADQPERYASNAGDAAAWLHHNDDHDLALGLAIDAGRYALASSICLSLVVTNPDVYTSNQFERHLCRVPHSELPRHPALPFVRGLVLATNPATRLAAAEYLRIAADHAYDDFERLTSREQLYHYIGREVSLRILGENQAAGEAARRAFDLVQRMSPAERDDLGEFLAMALAVVSYGLYQVGDVDMAGPVAEQAVAAATGPWWRNYALSFAIAVNGLNGRSREAVAAAALVDPDAAVADPRGPLPMILGVTGHAATLLDDFQFVAAIDGFDEVAMLMETAESWPSATWALAHARLGLGRAGAEAGRIAAAMAATPRPPGIGPNLATAALLNVLAILRIAEGNLVAAAKLLRSDTPFSAQLAPAKLLHQLMTHDPAEAVRALPELLAEPGHTIRSTVATETLGAALTLRAGNEWAAFRLLERAASRYHLFGARLQLLYLPAGDLAALRALAADRGGESAVSYLTVPITSPIEAPTRTVVALTPREIEVLAAWARSRTRSEVAAALSVSPNTVRTQLNNVYRKLHVTTKDAAIQRAIELDLLHPTDVS